MGLAVFWKVTFQNNERVHSRMQTGTLYTPIDAEAMWIYKNILADEALERIN
jgi:hypothetical protein